MVGRMLGPWKQRENKKEKSERERTDEERPWHFDPSGTYYAHSHPCTFSGQNSPHMIYIIPLHHFIHACICSCVFVYSLLGHLQHMHHMVLNQSD